ncbi:MAG: sensor domain-containing diguanylate cyclase [Solirubrobacteraceae bacterium]
MQAAVHGAPIGTLIRDLDGRIQHANAACARALGVQAEDLMGQTVDDLCPPRAAAAIKDADRRAIASGEQVSVEIELGGAGAVRQYELMIYPVREPDGDVSAIGCVAVDITDRVGREQELQRSRAYYETIVAAMGEGYCLTIDSTISAVNDALCELTGFAREQLIGAQPPYPYWLPGDRERAASEREDLLRGGGGTFQITLARADGSRFDAEVTTRPARNPDGTVLGFVSTFRDVSARRRYEQELERLATTDPLTGLANHRAFHERLGSEAARAMRHGRPLSLAILDLDHFKLVNDRYGHPAGDEVLREIAARLLRLARAGELIARVGGEEFAWVLPDSDADGAVAAAERARAAIRGTPVPPAGTVTVSAGVCDLAHASDVTSLYRHADEALYLAKRGGRDRTIRHPAAGG